MNNYRDSVYFEEKKYQFETFSGKEISLEPKCYGILVRGLFMKFESSFRVSDIYSYLQDYK